MRKIIFLSLFLIVSGCVSESGSTIEISRRCCDVTQVEEEIFDSSDFACGGVFVEAITSRVVVAYGNRVPALNKETQALFLDGEFTHFEQDTYEHIIALEWDLPYENTNVNMIRRTLCALDHFPRIKYLTLHIHGGEDVVSVSLSPLGNLKQLEHLEIRGYDLLVTGFTDELKLKSLSMWGVKWDPESDSSIGGAVVLASLSQAYDSCLEKLNLGGGMLLDHRSLRYLKKLKYIVTPVYYNVCDIGNQVETLDISESEVALDGYEGLVNMKQLKTIIVHFEDENEIRRILKGHDVDIRVAPKDACRNRNDGQRFQIHVEERCF